MLQLPQMNQVKKNQKLTTTFMGYNRNEILLDGEMYDMKNLSGDRYPLLTIRKKRAWTSYAHEVEGQVVDDPLTGIGGMNNLTLIVGEKVYWDMEEVEGLTVSTASDMCPKQIVNFGAYVLIFPDKKYFNTINPEDVGTIDRLFSASGTNVSLTMCRGDGTDYDMTDITVSGTAPASPANGDLWIDQSGDNDVLRQWSDPMSEWVEVATTFVKISATGIGTGLNIYDAVTIEGIEAVATATDRVKAQVAALNGSKIIYYGGVDYIVVAGLISATQSALKDNTVRADRKVPDMDYLVESNNRLWGCRYGLLNGQMVNEIHASALGDFRNWERYLGNSQDSYTASVGTVGPFTGALVLKGYPVFFKEGCVHLVHGSGPSGFQIETTACRGIQEGSWRSAVVVNEKAYYKSRTDVMMYDGSLPVAISEQMGGVLYTDARAGALGNKYYISMKDIGGEWTLFTYETEKGFWYKEDHLHVLGFAQAGDELFAIDEDRNLLWSMNGSVGTFEDDFEWSATFGIQGAEYSSGRYGRVRADTAGSRYISRFDIRMYLEEESRAKLQIMYDEEGDWKDQGEIRGSRLGSFVMPVIPIRCDHLRFRISGKGEMRIYSIARMTEAGGDGGAY